LKANMRGGLGIIKKGEKRPILQGRDKKRGRILIIPEGQGETPVKRRGGGKSCRRTQKVYRG